MATAIDAKGDLVVGTGESSKRVYRRADLIRLKMTDPARYDALQPEIMAAYAREWFQVYAISEPLDWESEWCEPQYRIGT